MIIQIAIISEQTKFPTVFMKGPGFQDFLRKIMVAML
jgi:hypothetical protein